MLEALSTGEDGPGVERHLEQCSDCRTYVAELRVEQQAFLKQRPAELFLPQLKRRESSAPRRASWSWLAVGLAAFSALVIAIPLLDSKRNVRLKGPAFTAAYRRPGAPTQKVGPDERLRAGDELKFSYRAPSDGQLLILDFDGTGRASVFYPLGATRSAPIRGGMRDFLPGSVVLDAAPGSEWLIAIFRHAPIALAPLAEQLEGQSGAAEPRVSCDGCRVETLRIQKE